MSNRNYPRLTARLARNSAQGIVVRYSARAFATVGWDRSCDEFQLGQWVKTRCYPDSFDLAPDGTHLIYSAYDFRRGTESVENYTAVSRAPYVKALRLASVGNMWMRSLVEGGYAIWLDSNTYMCSGETDCHLWTLSSQKKTTVSRQQFEKQIGPLRLGRRPSGTCNTSSGGSCARR